MIKDNIGNCVEPPEDEEVECPPGYNKNEEGRCVQDLCDELNEQLNNDEYVDRLTNILENVGSDKESGFAQNNDGSFTTLTATNNGHSLEGMGPNSIGYAHMHTNGTLFSPRDIRTFITMLTSAHLSTPKIPLDQIYATVISNGEVYTLRYDGTWEDLESKFYNETNKGYIIYMNDFNNFITGFQNYLNDKLKNDFRLFKINNDINTVEELTLNSNHSGANPCN